MGGHGDEGSLEYKGRNLYIPEKKPSVLELPTGHYKRRCFMLTGNFEGFRNWRTATGHVIALFGLGYGAKAIYDHWLKPTYDGMFKPEIQRMSKCLIIFL